VEAIATQGRLNKHCHSNIHTQYTTLRWHVHGVNPPSLPGYLVCDCIFEFSITDEQDQATKEALHQKVCVYTRNGSWIFYGPFCNDSGMFQAVVLWLP